MKKIWLKGVPFLVTPEELESLRESQDAPGTPMKEDEAYKLVCKLHPDQAPKKAKGKKDND